MAPRRWSRAGAKGKSPRPGNRSGEYVVDSPEIFVRIGYTPGQEFITGRYPVVEYAQSVTRNRIFDELTDKASQLRKAQCTLPLGILLCDGESSLLHAARSWNSYSIADIMSRFFTDHSDISFVTVFSLQHDGSSRIGPTRYQPRADIYGNPKCRTFAESLIPLFSSLGQYFPAPRQNPTNARLRLDEGEPAYKFCYFGEMTMTGHTIRMSARTLLELLAGKTSVEDFTRYYSLDPRQMLNPFMHKLRNGQLITSIAFHPSADRDDDDVTIEFGEPDPALSPFRNPPGKGTPSKPSPQH